MNFEYGFTLVQIGKLHMDLAVETAGPQKGLVQHISTVGGSQDDHPAVAAEPIHLS